MDIENKNIRVKPGEAIAISLSILAIISVGIIKLELVPHIPIVFAILCLLIFGLWKNLSMKELEIGMADGAKSGIGAIFIFLMIGMLISTWMVSGTIPTFIYLALSTINGKFFYAIVFLVSAIVGISIGSSLTTAATIGVAFMSVSGALGLSDALTAGAIISGAFFGDKMSPLSDTTNLAAMIVKIDLFEHIRNMVWTTVPAFILSFVLFAFFSPKESSADFADLELLKHSLVDLNIVRWYSLIPFVVLAILAIKKSSAILTLGTSIITALIIGLIIQTNMDVREILTVLYSGYKSSSGVSEIDALLSRGGIESMLFSVSLVLLALSMGGLMLKIGILPALISGIQHLLKKRAMLFSSAAGSAVGINFLLGEQYLAILLTGNTFYQKFIDAGLHPKNLSRVLEDAGTVVNPLVPWSICGIFLTNVLGVSTIEYFPFAFFCLLSPILTIIFGFTGMTITKINTKTAA